VRSGAVGSAHLGNAGGRAGDASGSRGQRAEGEAKAEAAETRRSPATGGRAGLSSLADHRRPGQIQRLRSSALKSLYDDTTSTTISQSTIDALPQGANAPVEKVLLQAPGVSQDSAASGTLHVRNDHANVQYRINGVMLPDGVTGFGTIFDAQFIGSIALITGALPAEFGMRTVGLVDITTRPDIFNNSGTIGFYGGTLGMMTPYISYGGTFGST
jgi:hypothetical protein